MKTQPHIKVTFESFYKTYNELIELAENFNPDTNHPKDINLFQDKDLESQNLFLILKKELSLGFNYFSLFDGNLLQIDDSFFEPLFSLTGSEQISDVFSNEIQKAREFLLKVRKVYFEKNTDMLPENDINNLELKVSDNKDWYIVSYNKENLLKVGYGSQPYKIVSFFIKERKDTVLLNELFSEMQTNKTEKMTLQDKKKRIQGIKWSSYCLTKKEYRKYTISITFIGLKEVVLNIKKVKTVK